MTTYTAGVDIGGISSEHLQVPLPRYRCVILDRVRRSEREARPQ